MEVESIHPLSSEIVSQYRHRILLVASCLQLSPDKCIMKQLTSLNI